MICDTVTDIQTSTTFPFPHFLPFLSNTFLSIVLIIGHVSKSWKTCSQLIFSPVFPTTDGFPAPIWRRGWSGRRRWTSVTLRPSKLPAPDASSSISGQLGLPFFMSSHVCMIYYWFALFGVCLFAHVHVCSLFSLLSRVIISLTECHYMRSVICWLFLSWGSMFVGPVKILFAFTSFLFKFFYIWEITIDSIFQLSYDVDTSPRLSNSYALLPPYVSLLLLHMYLFIVLQDWLVFFTAGPPHVPPPSSRVWSAHSKSGGRCNKRDRPLRGQPQRDPHAPLLQPLRQHDLDPDRTLPTVHAHSLLPSSSTPLWAIPSAGLWAAHQGEQTQWILLGGLTCFCLYIFASPFLASVASSSRVGINRDVQDCPRSRRNSGYALQHRPTDQFKVSPILSRALFYI